MCLYFFPIAAKLKDLLPNLHKGSNKKKNNEEEENKQPIMDYSYTDVSYILFINWNRVMSIFILMIVIVVMLVVKKMRTVLELAFHDAYHHTLILLLQIGSNHGYLMIILLLLPNMTMKEEEVPQLYQLQLMK